MEGSEVHFLMGNDENTVKVPSGRQELGLEPKPYCRRHGPTIPGSLAALDISYDDFIQTSEERHQAGCQKFIQKVYDAGDIYKGAYTGLYCNGCEASRPRRKC